MDGERYPLEDQMVTAVTVKKGDAHVLSGITLLAKQRGIIVRFEPHEADHIPDKGQTVTLLYAGGERVLRLRTVVAEIIEGLKLLLEPVAEVTEGERREFLRAEATVQLYCDVVSEEYELPGSAPDEGAQGWVEQIVDLSGSGVKFLWSGLCKKGDTLFIRMVLPSPNNPTVNTLGHVVRAKHHAETGRLDVAVHFDRVEERDRDLMINCVFRKYYEQLGSALGTAIDLDD